MQINLLRISKEFVNAALWHLRLVANTYELHNSVDIDGKELNKEVLFRLFSLGVLIYIVIRVIGVLSPGETRVTGIDQSPLRLFLIFVAITTPLSVSYYLCGHIRKEWYKKFSQWFAFHALMYMNIIFIAIFILIILSLLESSVFFGSSKNEYLTANLKGNVGFEISLILFMFSVYWVNVKRLVGITIKSSVALNFAGWIVYYVILMILGLPLIYLYKSTVWFPKILSQSTEVMDKMLHVIETLI